MRAPALLLAAAARLAVSFGPDPSTPSPPGSEVRWSVTFDDTLAAGGGVRPSPTSPPDSLPSFAAVSPAVSADSSIHT